ncbi:unnamed protein product [Caenorhabditis bovis]|uniref:Uncharacterized protein n=1 Tax=Caenorhabditis bovis TaxID=2654633 RepID=A0A8S1EWE2_9PELO|nr:unnamed protein product [Caenorhabditis bovis]
MRRCHKQLMASTSYQPRNMSYEELKAALLFVTRQPESPMLSIWIQKFAIILKRAGPTVYINPLLAHPFFMFKHVYRENLHWFPKDRYVFDGEGIRFLIAFRRRNFNESGEFKPYPHMDVDQEGCRRLIRYCKTLKDGNGTQGCMHLKGMSKFIAESIEFELLFYED